MGPIVGSLIGTGLALGVVHVLTGPDHVSALATLSANVSSWKAFFFGIQWGIGHSTGLLIIGIIFILITHAADERDKIHIPDGLRRFFQAFVGIFMILLGLYGIRRARDHQALGGNYDIEVEKDENSTVEGSSRPVSHDSHRLDKHRHDVERCDTERTDMDEKDGIINERSSCCGRCISRISTGSMAMIAGILHGLAGPGGVLGVIPAIRLHDLKLATIYLGCFCVSSTISMGTFAALYGTCTSRVGKTFRNEYLIELLSASLSILVGVLWLVLLALGKLDVVFP